MQTLLVGDDYTKSLPRPDGDDVYVVYWPQVNLVIPWPVGMTCEEAVSRWLGVEPTTAPNEPSELPIATPEERSAGN